MMRQVLGVLSEEELTQMARLVRAIFERTKTKTA